MDGSGHSRTVYSSSGVLRRWQPAPHLGLGTKGSRSCPQACAGQTLTALRSLFGHCKKTGRIFRDPTRGVRDGQRPLAAGAARPETTRELHLDDIDLGHRRLVIAGRARPLDDLTRSLLLTWLANRVMPRLTATLERLRVDRQLEEALTCGADPLHLAAVFGIDDAATSSCSHVAMSRIRAPNAARAMGPSSDGAPNRK